MAGTTNNIDLVPREDLDALAALNKELSTARENMINLLNPLKEAGRELSKTTLNYKELSVAINKVEEAEKKVAEEQKKAAKVVDEETKLREKLAALQSKEVTEVEKLRVQIQQITKARRDQAKEELALAGAKEQSAQAIAQSAQIEVEANSDRALSLEELARRDKEWGEQKKAMFNELSASQDHYDAIVVEGNTEQEESYKRLSDAQIAAEQAFDELGGKLQIQVQTLQELKTEQASVRDQIKDLDLAYKNKLITEDEYILRVSELKTLEAQHSATIKTLSDQVKYGTQINNTAVGSYKNLYAQYSLMKIQIDAMGEAEGANIEVKRKLEVQAKSLYEQMNNLQKATGRHQMDVGHYDLAVKDLTTTVRLFSPKLGMMVSRIQQLTPLKKIWIEVNKELVATLGMTARAATIAQAAILGLAVGAIILIVKAIKNANSEYKKSQEVVTKTSEAFADSMVIYARLQKQWSALGGDLSAQKKFIKETASEFNGLGVQVDNVNDAEQLLVGQSEAVVAALKARARAAAASEIATEKYRQAIIKEQEALNAPETVTRITMDDTPQSYQVANKAREKAFDDSKKLFAEADKYFDASISKNIEANDLLVASGIKIAGKERDLSRDRDDMREKEKKAVQDYALFVIKEAAEAEKRVYSDSKQSYELRSQALENFLEKQRESIRESAENQAEGLAPMQQALIWAKANAEIEKVEREGAKVREAISKDHADAIIRDIARIAEAREGEIAINESRALAELAKQYAEREIKTEEYEQRKTDIARQYAMERYDAEIAMINDQLQAVGLTEDQRLALTKKLGDARIAYQIEVNNSIISADEAAAKKREKIEDDLKKAMEKRERDLKKLRQELAFETINFISNLYSDFSQKEIGRLDEESKRNEQKTKEEIERITRLEESGAITKEEADARKAAVDYQAEQREEEIERRKREAQRRAAIVEKAAAVSRVIMTTAQAVIAALAPPPVGLGPILGAPFATVAKIMGALQLATILSTPIPQYAKGAGDHPGGLAIVGDGGRHEGILTPSGRMFMTPKTDTLVDLPAHTKVFPDMTKMYEHMAFMHINGVRKGKDGTITTKELEALQRENIQTIKGVASMVSGWKKTERYYNIINNRRRPTRAKNIH